MSKKKFQIHDLVSVEIDDELKDTNRIYDFLKSVTFDDSQNIQNGIEVNKVSDIDLSNHREYYDGIYISPDSLIDKRYGIEVIIQGNKIILNTKFRFIEWLMYAIQLALLRVDCVLIHSAAVTKGNQATFFPSWGGVGKTAILNDFVKKYDYDIIGDDLFILNKKGKMYSFPKPMVLYPYHKDLFPEVFTEKPSLIPSSLIKPVSKIVPKIKKLLAPFPALMNFARNNNPQVKWVLPSEVFGDDRVQKTTEVKDVFWLERSNEESFIKRTNPNLESQILGSTINEFDQRVVLCVNVLMGLGQLNNAEYLDRWSGVLKMGLKDAEKGNINVHNSVTINEIGTFINNLLNK